MTLPLIGFRLIMLREVLAITWSATLAVEANQVGGGLVAIVDTDLQQWWNGPGSWLRYTANNP